MVREDRTGSITASRNYKAAYAEALTSLIPPAPLEEHAEPVPVRVHSKQHGKARRRKVGKKQ